MTGVPAAGRLTGVGVGPGDPELLTVRATRLIAAADVIAYHRDRHGGSAALAAAQPYLREGQAEEVLQFPVTMHTSGPARRDLLAEFWEEAAARLAAHLEAGRDVVVLCAGDPAFYGSYQHLHTRLSGRFAAAVVPGISSVSAAAAAVSVPLVQHDEILTVLPGTLPDDRLRAALAGSDAVVVLRLGRALGRVRTALDEAGLLSRARYVERAGTAAERVVPLSEADPATVPDMSLALVPGFGRRGGLPQAAALEAAAEIPAIGGVTVIGLGPGDPAWLTPEAAAALDQATDLVGYRPYLARVAGRPGQRRHVTGAAAEAGRAAHALDLAAAGRQVAVVSSGDPGVFAMASAVIEQVAAEPGRWPDVPVTVLPGVTAAQAVAARVGAPLGHDYCVISLSAPWEVTAGRIEKAAAADLVLALYDPASRRRAGRLGAVRDLVLRYRDPATPVVLGRGVGRPGERVTVTTLGGLDPAYVDLSTLVIIGSSETVLHERPGGQLVFTPRQYEAGSEE